MNENAERPDPDALLRRLKDAEARASQGKLRVFFGFAPGVGKTYRMLQVARELASHGEDVVVGVVETHERADTKALVAGLPILPRRTLQYRGSMLQELDLDAALTRKPRVILIDELAHTNAPGSRHPKRWQDVEELLQAGIDVLSTMNVQHVESLNDVVAQITHVQVRETVPDSVLDRADAIELVDIAPEELLQRLKEGKVYLGEQAARAAEHFFRRGNLLALRELALRRTAQHVDEDVREYRQEHGVQATWPAGERILVCIGAAPSSGRLIRAAARQAASLRCPWVAAYAESWSQRSLSHGDRERLEAHLRVAESLGATTVRLSGSRIADALLDYARKHNVTRIVIGKPTHGRWRDRLRGSLLDEVVRASGDIDVHVISGEEGASPQAGASSEAQRGAPMRKYVAATALVTATVGVAMSLRALVDLPDPEMLFLLAVMLSAVWFGRGPSLLSAALGVACYDFFFVEPHYTFSVTDRRYVLTFAMMFGVGLALSGLASRLKRQEREARSREERTAALYALGKELTSADRIADIAQVAARQAAFAFHARALVLHAQARSLTLLAASPPDAVLDAKERGVAQWAFEHETAAGFGTDTLPGSLSLCVPLRAHASAQRVLGVLALVPAQREQLGADQRAFLDAFCAQVALALERAQLADEASAAVLRAKTEEMRSSLLSTVSHDLRTPLASITGAASALSHDERLSPATRAELTTSISEEAARLERLVANLLDMTRLEAGALALKRDWVPVEELVGSALARVESLLGARPVAVAIPADLPLVNVDPVLFEQLLVNLLENAAKHTPAGTALEITAAVAAGERVAIEVCDRGGGLTAGSAEQLFEKFFRGPQQASTGAGLGLAICRGIADAHGGRIEAHNRAGGGAVFRVILPIGGTPPGAEPAASDP